MVRPALSLLAICTIASTIPDTAFAQALPLKTSLNLGRPAHPVELSLSETDALQLTFKSGSVAVPAKGVKAATAEAVNVADGAAVAIVRVSASNGEWVALLGGRSGQELLFAGRTDVVGDPGERHAVVVESVPGAKANETAVSIATRFEGVTHCGSSAPLLVDRQVLEPKTMKLVPARVPPASVGEPVALTATPNEAPLAAPAIRALSAVASNQVDGDTGTLHVPRALVDGVTETHWRAQPGDVAILRWSTASLPIERLTLQVAGRTAKDKPATLLITSENASFLVSLPKLTGADRFDVALPTPLSTHCLAIALEPNAPAALQIGELQTATSLDRPEGMAQLISQLVQDGEGGAAAAELLAQLGAPAAVATAQRFDELSVRGQRRALRVLATALQLPEVRARAQQAARSSDAHVSEAALLVLSRGKEPGLVGLRELVLNSDNAGDSAARALANATPSEATALLNALSAPGGSDRPALRRAIMAIARRDQAAFRAASEAWLAGTPSASARIVFAIVAVGASLPELGTSVAEGAAAGAQSFDDRFRLSVLSGQLGKSDVLDSWLADQALHAEEWMTRRAAFDALTIRADEKARPLAEQLVKDPYPRVRAGTASTLAKAGKQTTLEEIAHNDHWPVVRAAAASALGTLEATRPALEQLLDDTSRRVRSAAVDALASQGTRDAWPLVEQRLVAANEWPEVQAAAVRFASQLCVNSARSALSNVARRGLRPDANEDERQLSLDAIHALHDLGGEAAADAKLLASRESGSEQLQQAITRFAPPRCVAKAP